MLTLKVYWGPHAVDFPLYSVYSADKYLVSGIEGSKSLHVVIDEGKVDLSLGVGSKTFVMNDRGATIDTIIVN